MDKRFEEIEHTADIAVRIRGKDLGEFYCNAAYALACIAAEVQSTGARTCQRIQVEAYDAETLLVTFLNELLFLMERDECAFTAFQIHEASCTQLDVSAYGFPITKYKHHVKAATFNDLQIVISDSGYEALVVFDV